MARTAPPTEPTTQTRTTTEPPTVTVPRPAPSARRPAPAKKGRHVPRPLVVLVLLGLIGGGVWWWTTTRDAATVPGPLVASGTLEADEILVGSEVAGRIVELAREGQSVQAGEVIGRLDDSLLQLQFRQADTATQQQLRILMDRYQLRSPTSGLVTRVPLHTGEVISPGQTVIAVADLSYLEMTAYVLESDLGRVRVGQGASVVVDPFPTRTYRGVVTSTNQRAEFTPRNVQTRRDRLNLVFGVKIRVDNPDGTLKPGMPADATFE